MGKKVPVAQSQDYHPAGHSSFASANPTEKLFTVATLTRPSTGEKYEQMMWPDHCVQGTPGAKLCVEPREGELLQQKGQNMETDCYSSFIDEMGTNIGFDAKLKEKGVENLVMFGLATDYCVFNSARDAAKLGFKVFVIPELCRGIDPAFDWKKYADVGCVAVPLADCEAALKG